MPKILAIVSNGISASMLQSELTRRNLSFSDVYLISGRRLTHPWTSQCAGYIVFDKVPSLSFLGQINTLGFYRQAVKALKQWLRDPDLAHILIANTDNLLANHALRWAERHPAVTVGVLVEGNMNFHEVTRKNRAWWRWWVKPPMAAVFGLRYRSPVGHLSGAFEPRVNEVITYSEKFLHAPPEKIVVLPFPQVERKVTPDPDAVLVLVTGIGQWMKEADFETFKAGFARWVRSLGASKIWVKLHPNYPSGGSKTVSGLSNISTIRAGSRCWPARCRHRGSWDTGRPGCDAETYPAGSRLHRLWQRLLQPGGVSRRCQSGPGAGGGRSRACEFRALGRSAD
jgi:hypothetical protein